MADQTTGENNGARRKRILMVLAAVVVTLAAVYGVWWYVHGQYYESSDDAYVHGNLISISPRESGTVISVNAEDTDLVRAGQVLVTLDTTDAKVALQQAEARLAEAVREVRQMFDQRAQLEATVQLRKASLMQARRDELRARNLKKIKGISTEGLQHAETALQTARAAYNESLHQLAASEAAVAGTTLETHPRVRQAEAQLRQAWLALQRTRIVAPASGYIAQRHVQIGQQVSPGTDLMAVVPLSQVWVAANFKETDLDHVRIGQPVTLTADVYGDSHVYHGKVAGLAAGTGDAFALLPAQNATGNWIKVVQRVPVRISIDPADLKGYPLRIGLSMEATIDTHDRNGKALATKPVVGPRYQTDVYGKNLDKVNALIQRIIHDNQGKDQGHPQ